MRFHLKNSILNENIVEKQALLILLYSLQKESSLGNMWQPSTSSSSYPANAKGSEIRLPVVDALGRAHHCKPDFTRL